MLLFDAALVFRKPLDTDHLSLVTDRKIWFYEIRADGYDPDKITGGGRPETPERNDIPDLLRQWSAYKASGFREPPGHEANSLLSADDFALSCWWAPIELVGENGYNLVAGRYKPQVAEKAPEEDAAQLIREVLTLEKYIADGLKMLLNEVEAS
jgi:type I restriction enzyme M protein